MSKNVLCSPFTDRHTEVTTVDTLSGFQKFFLQPIIKDRPNLLAGALSHACGRKKGSILILEHINKKLFLNITHL